MPQNKRESLIFSVVMCFCMVLGMSLYNVSRIHGWAFGPDVVAEAWLGLPLAYAVALTLDHLVASPIAMRFAFRFLVTPGKTSKRATTFAVSVSMVLPMVVLMSLYGALEAFSHTGAVELIPVTWLQVIPYNLVGAMFLNLFVAGPVVRAAFRRAFPEGTVLDEPAVARG